MAPPPFLPLDEFDFHHRLAGTSGIALVLFSNSGCSTCRAVERLMPGAVTPDQRLFRVDAPHSLALTRAFEVFHLPTLLLYRDGRYHARLNCVMTPAALSQAIAAALARPAEEEP
jgi:thioredoxin 1